MLEFLVDCNATQAARAGYSAATARQQASRLLLTNVDVQKALNECREHLAARLELSAEVVLNHLSETVTEARDDRNQSAAISGIRLLGDYLGMWGIAARRQPEGVPVEQAVVVEEDNRSDAERLRDFASDVRMLATQRQALEKTVEDFLDDIEDMVAEGCAGGDRAQ